MIIIRSSEPKFMLVYVGFEDVIIIRVVQPVWRT